MRFPINILKVNTDKKGRYYNFCVFERMRKIGAEGRHGKTHGGD